MAIWRNSTIQNFCADGTVYDLPSEVRIDQGKLVLSFRDGGTQEVWVGIEDGAGHYHLTCAANGATATLHRFSDDDVLDGWWSVPRKGYGMWRITLDE